MGVLKVRDPADPTGKTWIEVGTAGAAVGALNDLTDVDTATAPPEDGDGLVWDAATGQWVPGDMAIQTGWGLEVDPNGEVVLDTTLLNSTYARRMSDLDDVDLWKNPPQAGETLVFNGAHWEAAPGGGAEAEVEVGDTEPTSDWELWMDTTDTDLGSITGYLPVIGGEMTGNITFTEPGEGIVFPDGSKIAGGAAGIAVTGNVAMGSGNVIDFPNEADKAKVILYGDTTTGFGLGITSGTMNLFASGTIKFQQNSITGAEWARFDSGGLGPKSNVNATLMNGWSGVCQFRVTPATVTLSCIDLGRNVATGAGTAIQICGLPAGVPGPWRTLRTEAAVLGTQWQRMGSVLLEMRSTGLWMQCYYGFGMGNNGSDFQQLHATLTWTR